MSVPFVRNTAISRPVQRQPFSTGLTMPLAENTVFVPQIINNNATIMVPNNINTLNNITQRTLSATQKLPVSNLYPSTTMRINQQIIGQSIIFNTMASLTVSTSSTNKNHQDFTNACTIDDRLSIIRSNCVQNWLNYGLPLLVNQGSKNLCSC